MLLSLSPFFGDAFVLETNQLAFAGLGLRAERPARAKSIWASM